MQIREGLKIHRTGCGVIVQPLEGVVKHREQHALALT